MAFYERNPTMRRLTVYILNIIGACLAEQTLCADSEQNLSLMFSETEQEALKEALESLPQTHLTESKERGNSLRVDGIMFCTPLEWTVWINGKSYYAQHSQNLLFKILTVTPHSVTLKIKEKEVTLYPNQLYTIDSGSKEERAETVIS